MLPNPRGNRGTSSLKTENPRGNRGTSSSPESLNPRGNLGKIFSPKELGPRGNQKCPSPKMAHRREIPKIPEAPGHPSPEGPKENFYDLLENELPINLPDVLTFVSNNYFSIGVDSHLLYQFEQLRQGNPHLFISRHVNYLLYGMIGLKHILSPSSKTAKSLRHFCKLFIDKHEVALPAGLHCLVVLNIPSYCGGSNPWVNASNKDEVTEITPQSMSDGVVEVFGITGTANLGLTRANIIQGGIRVGQGSEVKMIVLQPIACQVDGEAHLIGPSEIDFTFHGRVKLLLNVTRTR
eukprot:TRINITY_DN8389_c0_g1_i2.p1 TRINITY_DN8389_c0_g1~~TRINITY_DN8389_c0_g1_i2.p1  ORF type:complete len:294 (+),score=49.09 TRINITY_DN8389_c0_g1_i2:466-1347(+)